MQNIQNQLCTCEHKRLEHLPLWKPSKYGDMQITQEKCTKCNCLNFIPVNKFDDSEKIIDSDYFLIFNKHTFEFTHNDMIKARARFKEHFPLSFQAEQKKKVK